jgi:hypothetical protein
MYTNGLLRGRLFFGPSKRSFYTKKERQRDIIEKTHFTGRREERSEEEEARKKKKKKKTKELLRLLR